MSVRRAALAAGCALAAIALIALIQAASLSSSNYAPGPVSTTRAHFTAPATLAPPSIRSLP